MAIRKTKNGKWVADITVGKKLDGSRDRRVVTCPTKAKAKKEEQRLIVLKSHNKGKSFGTIKFQDFVDNFFWSQKPNLRDTTKKGYIRDLKLRLIPTFGDMAMENINRADIQNMISNCSSKKVATNARETLSSILSLAVEMDIIDKNPAGYRYQYPPENKKDKGFYGDWLTSWTDIKKVLDYLERNYKDKPVHKICVLGLCFGLRKGEILALDSEKVNLEKHFIYIDQTYTLGFGITNLTDPKTKNSTRAIPIIKLAYPYLEKWSSEPGPIVKTRNKTRMSPNTAQDHMTRVFHRGKTFEDGTPLPKLTMFSLRHSFANSCINVGFEIGKVSAWLGHCDVNTTRKSYVKPKLKDLASEAALLDALI